MKDNKYTRAINAVRISDKALENGLKYARENSVHERKGKVIVMKKQNIKKIGLVAAAACIAAVIGFVGMIHTFVNDSNSVTTSVEHLTHNFVVTANAEEITANAQVEIGQLDGTGAGYGTTDDGNVSFRKYIEFPVRCEGEDIESITYSVDKCSSDKMHLYFMFNSEFESVTENNGTDNEGNETRFIPETTVATEYTVPYDAQPTDDQFGKKKNSEKYDPVILSIGFDDKPEFLEDTDVRGVFDEIENEDQIAISEFFFNSLTSLFDKHEDEMRIDVTVNFNDGTTQSKTIKLSSEKSDFSEDFTLVKINGSLEEK